MKTRKELYDELEKAIKEVHTYDIPEVLATPIVAGNKSYLDWIANETQR